APFQKDADQQDARQGDVAEEVHDGNSSRCRRRRPNIARLAKPMAKPAVVVTTTTNRPATVPQSPKAIRIRPPTLSISTASRRSSPSVIGGSPLARRAKPAALPCRGCNRAAPRQAAVDP